jgi:hypothetical protein
MKNACVLARLLLAKYSFINDVNDMKTRTINVRASFKVTIAVGITSSHSEQSS